METIGISSRRQFVAGGLITVAAATVSGCSAGGSEGGSISAPLGGGAATTVSPLTQSEVGDWDKLVGTAFVMTTEAGSTFATLATLERTPVDLNRPASLARHQPFYAYFEMDPRLVPLGGKTYKMSHATKGAFDLFLSQPSEVRGKGVVVAVLN